MRQNDGQEKLLLMGISTDSSSVLAYAKRRGVYTIATDNQTAEECPQKREADEYWMIDLKDLDSLEKRCKRENVTGIYAGNNEFCLEQTRELCRRLNLSFYISDEAWSYDRDKEKSKRCCERCNVDVPKQYELDLPVRREQLDKIVYPVVVKPVDSCAMRGLFKCCSEQELLECYGKSLAYSESGRIIVEEFVEGDEIAAHYFVVDGKPILIGMEEVIGTKEDKINKFAIVANKGRFYKEYKENINANVEKLLREMGCTQGNIFAQFIRRNGKYYFLESGYRLEGIGFWSLWKQIYGFHTVELMVDLALGNGYSHQVEHVLHLKSRGYDASGLYLLWGIDGKIHKIEGLEEVKNLPGVDIFWNRYKEGDRILNSNTLNQIAYGMCITAQTRGEFAEKIEKINNTLHMYGEHGENMLLYYHDYKTCEEE